MKKIKKTKSVTILLVMVLLLSLTVAGCGTGTATPAEPSKNDSPRVIQVGHVSSEDMQDPYHRFAANFSKNVEEATDGSIKIEVITGGQLGQEREMFEGMQLGTVDMAIMTNSYASNFVKEAALFDLPFLFPDYDTANTILDGPVGQKVLGSFEGSGVTPLAWGVGGFRQLVTNGSGVRTPKDIVGKKIRSMGTDMYLATYAALGVNAIPMAYGEVIPALQQGTIDGLDLPLSVLAANRFYDVADYVSMLGHFYSPLVITISDSIWNDLSSEEQAILKQAAIDAGNEERKFIAENEVEKLKILTDNGMTAIEDVDYEAFQQAVKPLYEEQKAVIGEDLVDELMEALKN